MWIKDVFLGFIGLASGFAVAAGVFAFVVTLGVRREDPYIRKGSHLRECHLPGWGVWDTAVHLPVEGAAWENPAWSLWPLGGDLYRLSGGGVGRDLKHLSHHVPACSYESGPGLGATCHGDGEDGGSTVFLCASYGKVNRQPVWREILCSIWQNGIEKGD